MEIFFWNLKKRTNDELTEWISCLLKYQMPDILVFAECAYSSNEIVNLSGGKLKLVGCTLDEKKGGEFPEIKIFATQVNFDIKLLNAQKRIIACLLEANGKKILLSGIHLAGRLYSDRDDQYRKAKAFIAYLNDYEIQKNLEIESTIVVGDFNINPFEKAFLVDDSIFALNIESSPGILKNKKHFYNPMASLCGTFIYGSDNAKVPGTYFHRYPNSGKQEQFWNVIDGIIFRHNLMNCFKKSKLEIVTKLEFNNDMEETVALALYDFENTMLTGNYSDHLPVRCVFDFANPYLEFNE